MGFLCAGNYVRNDVISLFTLEYPFLVGSVLRLLFNTPAAFQPWDIYIWSVGVAYACTYVCVYVCVWGFSLVTWPFDMIWCPQRRHQACINIQSVSIVVFVPKLCRSSIPSAVQTHINAMCSYWGQRCLEWLHARWCCYSYRRGVWNCLFVGLVTDITILDRGIDWIITTIVSLAWWICHPILSMEHIIIYQYVMT